MRVRRGARALLLDGGSLVLLRRTVPGRPVYWTTPGGKIEPTDASTEAALRRELDEELGATAGPVRQVFACAEQSPELYRLNTFYVCRLVTMDLSRRHGPEFDDPSKGRYDVDLVPCTPAGLEHLNLVPEMLAAYLRDHAGDLPGLVP
ncbi:8-oxo-dGTP pyrophosphatase MutT (NUDIX family) [Actinomadura luteofluorescens]|uniref:8-oxo-dGTP pyrophosphatase MutT (NUDIX family) n=1 Tax=Actinomadura luteofluorescens TaxID=46163 RepID=A0A7Y9EQP5_9ACTN|nr:NUDIX hydrolase [Actinomadura luteofluorescens]NYD52200.1 8-oxo-dGTP pyrophosphatase MutT (NUDIX family) [Actinomadura luteofluorescens]